MKDYIVAWPLLLLLLFFPLQDMVENINNARKVAFNNIVHQYAQRARTDGAFTPENINQMKGLISNVFYIDESEIQVDATTDIKYRMDEFDEREFIDYSVSVPITRIIAMHKFWGMTDEENQGTYTQEGEVASEKLKPVELIP